MGPLSFMEVLRRYISLAMSIEEASSFVLPERKTRFSDPHFSPKIFTDRDRNSGRSQESNNNSINTKDGENEKEAKEAKEPKKAREEKEKEEEDVHPSLHYQTGVNIYKELKVVAKELET